MADRRPERESDRDEEIRQIEMEMHELECIAPLIDRHDLDTWAGVDADFDDGTIEDYPFIAIESAVLQIRTQRTLSRLRAIRDELASRIPARANREESHDNQI